MTLTATSAQPHALIGTAQACLRLVLIANLCLRRLRAGAEPGAERVAVLAHDDGAGGPAGRGGPPAALPAQLLGAARQHHGPRAGGALGHGGGCWWRASSRGPASTATSRRPPPSTARRDLGLSRVTGSSSRRACQAHFSELWAIILRLLFLDFHTIAAHAVVSNACHTAGSQHLITQITRSR